MDSINSSTLFYFNSRGDIIQTNVNKIIIFFANSNIISAKIVTIVNKTKECRLMFTKFYKILQN